MSDAELRRFEEQLRRQTKRRQQMRKVLSRAVTPFLRKHKFTGSCPHFRRLGPERFDLLTFQFDKFGDGFVIELGQCLSSWSPSPGHAYASPEKLQPMYLDAHERARIQPGPFLSREDHAKALALRCQGLPTPVCLQATANWFRYDSAEVLDDYKRIADSVLPFLEKALEMFESFENVPKIDEAC